MDELTTIPVERSGPAPIVRIGLLGAAAAALVAVAILAAGAGASPTGMLAAGANSTTGGAAPLPGVETLDNRGGPDGMGGFGRGISITAISGNSLSLATVDGWTRTITVDSGTTYTKGNATIALSDLAVGDEIRFAQTAETDGTFTIDSIAVIPPSAGGMVTAVAGSTITVTQRDGTAATITVTSATTYEVNGTTGKALTDVTVGMVVMAEGTKASDGSLTATTVRAGTPGAFGPGGHGFGRGHGAGDLDNDAGTTPGATTAPGATSDSAG